MPAPDRPFQDLRALWDAEAQHFDEEADHGLRDPQVRSAWVSLLAEMLGAEPLRVADLGCGTGSLSVLLRDLGHDVTGLDLSPRMLDKARAKAGKAITFLEGDASRPNLPRGGFDAVVCRHVLWALPDLHEALSNWAKLLVAGGSVLLIEGRWHTGAGLSAEAVRGALPPSLRWTATRSLSDHHALWGGPVPDERFLITAERP